MYKNIIFLLISFLTLIYLLKTFKNKILITPGDIMVTNRTYSNWQFIKPFKYSSQSLIDLYNVKYYNIYNTKINSYNSFVGNIVLFDKNDIDYYAFFKDSPSIAFIHDFIYYFNKYVNMKNETYNVALKNGYLEIMFLNNCSNNTVLFEKEKICHIKNYVLNNINIFLNSYFDEKFITLNDFKK